MKVSSESVSANVKAAEDFLEILDKLIVGENYLPEQISSMDKTSLFWKWVPERNFIHKQGKSMPGFEAFNDRLIVYLGGHVTGYKLKPFLIWHDENSRVFKQINKHTLPVYYRSNEKSLMSQLLF